LNSGLKGEDEFKEHCEGYRELLRQAGFRVAKEERIGPRDREDLGGVYVYVATLETAS
jgi:hypothetical protein